MNRRNSILLRPSAKPFEGSGVATPGGFVRERRHDGANGESLRSKAFFTRSTDRAAGASAKCKYRQSGKCRFTDKLRNSILLFLALLLLLGAFAAARAAALQLGSEGEDVKALQTKLKRWGYYGGTADGKFGPATKKAVIAFQQKNGLSADGVVGEATARALGLTLGGNSGGKQNDGGGAGSNDAYLLARLVYGEARGEPYKGKVAVAAVALNRVKSASFPNSVAGVVYQSGAFDVVADGQINLAPDSESIRAARDAMNGYDPTNGCLYYHNPDKSTSKWMREKSVKVTIGSHAFF